MTTTSTLLDAPSVSPPADVTPDNASPIIWSRRQLWADVVSPFLATRLTLLFLGWLADYFPVSPNYPIPEALARGWTFSPYRLLDIWGRWDTGWYMGIVRRGYTLDLDHTQQQTNLAFFPLYPMLVRALLWLVPDQWETDGVVLLVGVALSNLFFLGGLVLLYGFAQALTHDVAVARRAVLYLILFPTAFFLSTFYTDATFFFLVVGALFAAHQRQWQWAALAAALMGITRPLGILMTPVLFWLYLSAAGWRIQNVRGNVLWLCLAPLPFLLHLGWLGLATGDWLAPMHAQQTFFRGFAWPWITLLTPNYAQLIITPLEQVSVTVALVIALIACWRLPSAGYGLWVFALLLPPIFTGVTTSTMRYILSAVPVFVLLAQWGKFALLDHLFRTLFFAIQVVLMIAWIQYYFIG